MLPLRRAANGSGLGVGFATTARQSQMHPCHGAGVDAVARRGRAGREKAGGQGIYWAEGPFGLRPDPSESTRWRSLPGTLVAARLHRPPAPNRQGSVVAHRPSQIPRLHKTPRRTHARAPARAPPVTRRPPADPFVARAQCHPPVARTPRSAAVSAPRRHQKDHGRAAQIREHPELMLLRHE